MTEIKKIADDNLEKKYKIKISAEELNKEINDQAEKQKEKVKIDGFRKGKVPLDFIKNKYSAVLLSNSAENIVESNVSKIIEENKYNLINRPKIDIKTLEINKDFDFEITFELYPEIPDIKYDKIKLKKQKIKIDKKDIEEGKNRLLKTKTNWKEEDKDYKAKNGDKLKIDFLGKINGEPFEGGKAEKYELELGSKSFIDNFEEQLIGKKADDKLDITVNFPKNYHKKELSSKPAVFEVKVHSVSSPELPTLNDEFLKENFNIESVAKLEEMIEKELTAMYETASKNKIKEQVFDWLKKNIKFEIPKSIIKEEFNRQWQFVENELKTNPNKFKTEKDKEKEMAEIKQNAEDSVKLGLILSEIGKANDIKVENNELINEIRRKASAYPGQEQIIIDFYMKNKQTLNQITGILLEEKVIDFILNKATVDIEEITAADFLKQTK